ncbi:MAG: copper amine oxidase N-terminal domain-containing protein, partial [Aquificaceae bacterium]|nr:copper amine oxidase N-terminal domain-containing protein [Aquificaceae bacterium]
MMRKCFLIGITVLFCLSSNPQDLPQELKEELPKGFLKAWEGRIPLKIEPNQRYPRNFEEAKHWLREASLCSVLADILRADLNKPYKIWAPFYRRAVFLSKGVYEKFGEFLYACVRPEIYWGKFGDVVMPIDQYFNEYMEWIKDPNRPDADPFEQLYFAFMDAVWIASVEERKQLRKKPYAHLLGPFFGSTSPLKTLIWSLYHLVEWKQAMKAIEEDLASLYPQIGPIFFDMWIECATKVYRKGALPTKFLLAQNPKTPQHGLGLLSSKGVPFLLRFRNGHHYVPLKRVALCLDWKVEQEGKEIVIKTKDREVKLRVGSKVGYVNGFKVNLPSFVEAERNDVWIPLQFVAAIAKSK